MIAASNFRAHPLLLNRHCQTIVPKLFHRRCPYPGKVHQVTVSNGDQVAVLENPGTGSVLPNADGVLLVHGLGSSGHEPGVVSQAKLLQSSGNRVFRMHHRGIAEGALLAKGIYHGDRGQDIAAVIEYLVDHLKLERITLVAYSMSANMVLKMLGSAAQNVWPYLKRIDRAICLCPPIDMLGSAHALSNSIFGIYNRSITASLTRYLNRREKNFPDVSKFSKFKCSTVMEMDSSFVCYEAGYRSVEDYYEGCSPLNWIPYISTATHVLCSIDDPVAPGNADLIKRFPNIYSHITKRGGHLGFLSMGPRLSLESWANQFVAELVEDRKKGNRCFEADETGSVASVFL